jgi:hypothetical protein
MIHQSDEIPVQWIMQLHDHDNSPAYLNQNRIDWEKKEQMHRH